MVERLVANEGRGSSPLPAPVNLMTNFEIGKNLKRVVLIIKGKI